MSKRDFDSLARDWEKEPGRVRVAVQIADAMRERLELKPTDTLIDFGAGTGLVSLRLLPEVGRVVAADSSRGMLDVLEEKVSAAGIHNIRTLLWDIENEPPEKLDADVLVSAMTMHHIGDIAAAARAFHSALAAGGRIAIADLDPDNGQFHPDPTGIEHEGFNRDDIAAIFAKAGFVDIQIATVCSFKKPSKDGDIKEFSIFLLTAKK